MLYITCDKRLNIYLSKFLSLMVVPTKNYRKKVYNFTLHYVKSCALNYSKERYFEHILKTGRSVCNITIRGSVKSEKTDAFDFLLASCKHLCFMFCSQNKGTFGIWRARA